MRAGGALRRAGRYAGWAFATLAAAAVLVHAWYAVQILWWRTQPVGETSFMAHRMAELQRKNPAAKLAYQWVPYERISPHLKRAMIAAEDAKFVDHEGFDWEGIQRAIEKNERRGRIVAGGSTITQQLAKNLFLTPERSWLRKGQEAVITLMLEALLPKRRIFEIYLNVIEWGSGVFGAEAAARRHFGTSAARLSAEQAARLAAMAPNPRFYERNPGAPGLARKTSIILGRMASAETP
jgi:monofunctional biosynthetic peptidoglycan transglycosylase